MRSTRLLFLLATSVVAACASGGGGAAGTSTSAAPTRGNSNVITAAEIEGARADIMSAYDLVALLRPMMLRPRNLTAGAQGAGTTFGVVVYAGETRLGDIEQLRTVMRGTVREIRYVSATDATTRWGTGHSHGVIHVLLR